MNRRRDFLQECVNSVLRQTIDGWEAIVVDDASRHPDVEGLIKRTGDPRVRLVRQIQNRGEAVSRNMPQPIGS
jgi:glycosyltransferase involved in cell wall biosynthesis